MRREDFEKEEFDKAITYDGNGRFQVWSYERTCEGLVWLWVADFCSIAEANRCYPRAILEQEEDL